MGEIQLSWVKDMDIGIARIFNVYGENEAADENAHVVPALIQKAIGYPSNEFIVWGDGNQSRDFLYVSDAIDALLRLEEKASHPPTIVNIGSHVAVPISALAEEIVKISGKNMSIKYDPSKPVGPISRTADTSRTRALLEWSPKIDLADGLKRTYTWLDKGMRA